MSNKWRNIFFLIVGLLFIYFGFFVDADGNPKVSLTDEKTNMSTQKNNEMNNIPKQPTTEEYVTNSELNDIVISNFITQMLGENYEMLVYLFNNHKMKAQLKQLGDNEEKIPPFAYELGERIELQKNTVKGNILSIQRNYHDQGFDRYIVILHFHDGSRKELILDVKDGHIITDHESL